MIAWTRVGEVNVKITEVQRAGKIAARRRPIARKIPLIAPSSCIVFKDVFKSYFLSSFDACREDGVRW